MHQSVCGFGIMNMAGVVDASRMSPSLLLLCCVSRLDLLVAVNSLLGTREAERELALSIAPNR